MRKICVVTGTRAEFGLLSRLMRMINESTETQLQIVATNMHLSPKYGNTYREIEANGFIIDQQVPIIDENGTNDAQATIMEMSRAFSGMAEAYKELNPDLIIVLGDRHEILAAATTALMMRIPIVHLYGGEITEGAYDDAIRHSITQMSQLHFTSCEAYRHRVIQLGIHPNHVFNVGSIGVENITKLKLMNKADIEADIQFEIDDRTILVTYHPVTMGHRLAKDDIEDFITVLEARKDLRIIFTMPNNDVGGQFIVDAIHSFVSKNADRAKAYKSLGVVRYLSVMKEVAAVVGNSSSGVVEAPSFGIPTLNIGDRQKGRLSAESVWHCDSDKASVMAGLDMILSPQFRKKASTVRNPYEKENTAAEIFKIISHYPLEELKQKHFYDILQ